jgi:hypothetical protein
MKKSLFFLLAFALAISAHAQGPTSYSLARTDGCVGSVATPNFTPTNLNWTAGVATVTSTINPGANTWVYFSGYSGAAIGWNIGWVLASSSSSSNFTFAWAPTLASTSSGIGTVGLCNLGAGTGTFGSPLIYQEGVSDPVPYFRLDLDTSGVNCPSYLPPFHADCAVAGVPFVDPDFGAYEIFLTDQTTQINTTVHEISSGGGEIDKFGIGLPNDVLYAWTDTGSKTYLAHILEQNFLAHACATSKCVVLSNVVGAPCTPITGSTICTSTQISNGGNAMSRNASDPPNTLYEANLPAVVKTTFTTGTTMGVNDSISRAAYVNFGSDSGGLPCHVVPSDYVSTWNGEFKVSDAGAITFGSGGGGSYQSIWEQVGGSSTVGAPQTVTNDVFIMPVNHVIGGTNGNTFMFQFSAGTTSGTEPNWAANCPTQGSVCADGAASATNIGKVNGQGPGFDVLHFDPHRGCRRINTRLAKIYNGTNEGVNWPSTGAADPAGQIITDDAVICFRMGGTNCGTGGTVNLTDKFTLHAADQKFDSRYGGIGPTGAGALNKNYTGGGGTWPEISATNNGSCTIPVSHLSYVGWPNATWVTGSNYASGVYAASPADRNYYKLVTSAYVSTPSTIDPATDSSNWNPAAAYCYNYVPDWYSNISRPLLEIGPNYGADSHFAAGYRGDYRGGPYYSHLYSQPNCQTITGGCTYVGAPNPGIASLSKSLPNDGHPSHRNTSPGDLQPIFDPTVLVPAWGGVGMSMVAGGGTGVGGYSGAGFNEEISFSTDGLNTLSRYGHNYCTASSPWFGVQNCLGVVSKDGKMLAYTSDFMNSRGDQVSGSATCANPLRGQYQPSKNGAVTYLDYAMPITNNTVYRAVGFYSGTFPSGSYVTSGTGTEGAALPNFSTVCGTLNSYCTTDGTNNPATGQPSDGNVLWQNAGQNSCRGDIALIDLNAFATPATPNPTSPNSIILSENGTSPMRSAHK